MNRIHAKVIKKNDRERERERERNAIMLLVIIINSFSSVMINKRKNKLPSCDLAVLIT